MSESVKEILEELVEQQRGKLLKLAREFVPQATSDDILQPNDFEELESNVLFRYEEGVLAGILAASSALRAQDK